MPTWDAQVSDPEELLVSARISEERRVDHDVALPAPGACAVHQEVDVDVAVAGKGNAAAGSQVSVVAAVAGRLEDDDPVGGTGHGEDRVETGHLLYDRSRHSRRRGNYKASSLSSLSSVGVCEVTL